MPSGELEPFQVEDLGLRPDILEIIQNKSLLDNVLGQLEDVGYLEQCDTDELGEVKLKSRDSSKFGGVTAENGYEEWKQAMILACFPFIGPGYSINSSQYGLRALPLFRRLTQHQMFLPTNFDDKFANTIVSALLQASVYSDIGWKSDSVAIAQRISSNKPITADLRARLALRESFVLRSKSQFEKAESVIDTYFATHTHAADSQLQAIHGLLWHSKAWILIETRKFKEAISVTSQWLPFKTLKSVEEVGKLKILPLYEFSVVLKVLSAQGIANKHLGNWACAIPELRAASGTDTESRVRLPILAHLCDAYCESKQPEVAQKQLEKTFKNLEIDPLQHGISSLHNRFIKPLLLSYVESLVQLGQDQGVDILLHRIRQYFSHRSNTTLNEQRLHTRALLLTAQRHHRRAIGYNQWLDTLNAWRELESAMEQYDVMFGSRWDYAIVCFSLYHTGKNLKMMQPKIPRMLQPDGSLLDKGKAAFEQLSHFWIVQTHWVEYILSQDLGISTELSKQIRRCAVG